MANHPLRAQGGREGSQWRSFLPSLLLCFVVIAGSFVAVFLLPPSPPLPTSAPPPSPTTPATALSPPSSLSSLPSLPRSDCGSDRQCSGSSNDALIENMQRRGLITSPSIAAAMKRVDRAHYVTRADLQPPRRAPPSSSQTSIAYLDSPQYIGYGATISAPHMHALCTELMMTALQQGPAGKERRVLDVGSGSGYLAAVLSRVMGEGGRVYGVEHIRELVEVSKANLEADDPALLQRIDIQQGDGRLGLPSAAPFDAIHVGAAAAQIPPALIDQLKEGGVLVIPVGEDGEDQTLDVIEKKVGGEVSRRTVTGVRYVPLTSADKQRGGARS